MRPLGRVLTSVVVVALVGCGVSPQAETKETQPTMSQAQTVNPLVAADVALARELRFIVGAVAQEASKATEPPRTVYTAPPYPTVPTVPTSSYDTSLQPCGGGDYPPCYRAESESRGHYDAYNPSGCYSAGRSGCYGKWQFGWFWAGKLGLPLDLATATPQQQDEAARILWADGAGCSNWAAC